MRLVKFAGKCHLLRDIGLCVSIYMRRVVLDGADVLDVADVHNGVDIEQC